MVQGTAKVEAGAQTHAADNARAGKRKKRILQEKTYAENQQLKTKKNKVSFFCTVREFLLFALWKQKGFHSIEKILVLNLWGHFLHSLSQSGEIADKVCKI